MTEQWVDVVGYEGLYRVSDQGRVYSVKRGKTLHPRRRQFGYVDVTLSKDGNVTHHLVHRLVALAFIPNPDNKPQVNHMDGNRWNDRAENLEWVTASENQRHRFDVLLRGTRREKAVICLESGKEYPSIRKAAKAINRSASAVSSCCHKINQTAGGQHFRFKEDI